MVDVKSIMCQVRHIGPSGESEFPSHSHDLDVEVNNIYKSKTPFTTTLMT